MVSLDILELKDYLELQVGLVYQATVDFQASLAIQDTQVLVFQDGVDIVVSVDSQEPQDIVAK